MPETFEALGWLLENARTAALSAGRDYIGGETLWQCLLESDAPAVAVIPEDDRDFALRKISAESPDASPLPDTDQHVPLSLEGECVFRHAARLAYQLEAPSVEAAHLLLALLCCRYEAADGLKARGWVFRSVRSALQHSGIIVRSGPVLQRVSFAVKLPGVPSRLLRLIIGRRRVQNHTIHALGYVQSALLVGDYQIALAAASVAVQIAPADPAVAFWMAHARVLAGHFAEALPFAQQIRGAFADAPTLGFLESFALLRLGRLDEALAVDVDLARQHPDDAEVLNNLGFGLASLGRHAEAIDAYDRSLALDPDYDFALNNRGFSLHQLGRTAEGEALIHHSLTINRGNAYAFRNLALIAESRGDAAAAHDYARRAFHFYYREDFGEDIDHLRIPRAQA